MITREQSAHLAAFTRTIRPAWDELAIINILADHQDRHPIDIFEALIVAATNPNAVTPRAIDWPEHWRHHPTKDDDGKDITSHESCKIDGHSGRADNCPQCASERLAPQYPEPCPKHTHEVTNPNGYRSTQSGYHRHNCLDCRRETQAAKEVT